MYVAPVVGDRGNVLATQGGRLLSFDLAGRRIGWEISGGFAGPVTVHNGTIYVIKSGAVEARSESDGTLLWSWAPPSGAVGGALVAANNVVFASTQAATYAIDAAARRHTWSHPSGGHLAVTPDGRLLIVEQMKVTAVNIR
jgi:outer membrane protein assembly factor BamB